MVTPTEAIRDVFCTLIPLTAIVCIIFLVSSCQLKEDQNRYSTCIHSCPSDGYGHVADQVCKEACYDHFKDDVPDTKMELP